MSNLTCHHEGAKALSSSGSQDCTIDWNTPCWLTVCHRRILRESACLNKCCFWWGCSIMFPLRMLAACSERVLIRSLLAPATSCLTTLGCVLARMHMASACLQRLQGITPWGRGWTWRRCRFLAVAVAMVGAVLFWPCCCGRRVVCRHLAAMASASSWMKP